MADLFDEQGDVNWNAVLERLKSGHVVEIPCEVERECVRRTRQVSKRAERQDLAVAVVRGEQVLRIEPRPGEEQTPEKRNQSREERQKERARRREASRTGSAPS